MSHSFSFSAVGAGNAGDASALAQLFEQNWLDLSKLGWIWTKFGQE